MNFENIIIANHATIAVVIEGGGAILLIAITLLPFLVIRHPFFKPTRWRHIISAYFLSFLILLSVAAIGIFADTLGMFIYANFTGKYNFTTATSIAIKLYFFALLVVYPLLVFYSAKLLYGTLNRKRFWISTILASSLFLILFFRLAFFLVIIFMYVLLPFFV